MSYVRLFWLAVTAILSSSVLIQWIRRPLSCYNQKHDATIETAETTTTSSSALRQLNNNNNDNDKPGINNNNIPIITSRIPNKKYCQWTVAAGDSNNRMAFEEWMGIEQNFGDGRRVVQAKRTPLLYETAWGGHHCTERWADKEMVITFPPNKAGNNSTTTQPPCHIISSRFMIDQRRSVARLQANLTNSSYCGSYLETPPLPEGYERPPKPDMVWYTAGFWGLRAEKRSSCEQRFSHVVDAMVEWNHDPAIKRVVWQTGFPVNYHHEFNNSMVAWDYHCQKKLASQYGIEIADLYGIITLSGGPKNNLNPGDCHLIRHKRLIPHQYLDRCCGGWETYLKK